MRNVGSTILKINGFHFSLCSPSFLSNYPNLTQKPCLFLHLILVFAEKCQFVCMWCRRPLSILGLQSGSTVLFIFKNTSRYRYGCQKTWPFASSTHANLTVMPTGPFVTFFICRLDFDVQTTWPLAIPDCTNYLWICGMTV